ncbi:cell division protein ZapE [Rhodovulum sulfidophilum]|uniref:cell division protein ZapE n=1 Tax=Rhodovulum sulfidophilum TaxID=35806 RepID=UPI001EED9804|nr:cell division protein ZapE [Rhodovulum sulfidophilum]MCE8419531.1 AFG1 family ATPase [Rhodovulum sulfidophilum]MCE8439864.1 AFG1 family ATPase [Rhodovulum sulfidophilum]
MSETLKHLYDARAAGGDLRPDPAQIEALVPLERIRQALENPPPAPRGGFFRKAPPPEPVRGLYLWGGVGRGKSMLMDLFFEAVAIEGKRRVHFHAFMQEVHRGLHAARAKGADDALKPVAAGIAEGLKLLCFDEMQIVDITDAMIVGRLFEFLFAAGVTVVTTSNRVPGELYKDGLQRERFVPFIKMLEERLEVMELGSATDYRQNRLTGEGVYFSPSDRAARARMAAIWEDFTHGAGRPLVLRVQGRQVELPLFHNGVARATFWDLCARPLGPADYLAVAQAVRVLILEDIPRLSSENYNEARRFVTLIDALYEGRVRLIASAAAAPEMLYLEGEGSFEFERTASRLREMQAADWAKG